MKMATKVLSFVALARPGILSALWWGRGVTDEVLSAGDCQVVNPNGTLFTVHQTKYMYTFTWGYQDAVLMLIL